MKVLNSLKVFIKGFLKPRLLAQDRNNLYEEVNTIEEINIISFENRFEYNLLAKNKKEGLLGFGGFGKVYLILEKLTGTKFALKWALSESDNSKYSILDEVKISKKIPRHINIAIYLEGFKINDKNLGCIHAAVMQYYPDGNLEEYLNNNTLELDVKCSLANGIIDGIFHLHTNDKDKICHRDLKPSNILIQEREEINDLGDFDAPDNHIHKRKKNIVPKITDFGLSKIVKQINEDGNFSKSVTAGTHYYTAPEQFDPKIEFIGFNSDLWSLGLIIFEIFVGAKAFDDGKSNEKISNKNAYLLANIQDEKISEKINDIPEPYKEIIKKCLKYNSKDRIKSITNIKDILNGKAKVEDIANLIKQIEETTAFAKKQELALEVLKLDPENKIALRIKQEFEEEEVTIVRSNLVLLLSELIIKSDYQAVIDTINKQDEATKNSTEINAILKIANDEITKIKTQKKIDILIEKAIDYATKNNFKEANKVLEKAKQNSCSTAQLDAAKAEINKQTTVFINALLVKAKIEIDAKRIWQARQIAKKVLQTIPSNEEAKDILAIKYEPINLKPILYGVFALFTCFGIYWGYIQINKPGGVKGTEPVDTTRIPSPPHTSIVSPISRKANEDLKSIWYKQYQDKKNEIAIAVKNKQFNKVYRLAYQAKSLLKWDDKLELDYMNNLIHVYEEYKPKEGTIPLYTGLDRTLSNMDTISIEANTKEERLKQYDMATYYSPIGSNIIFIKLKGTKSLWGALNYIDATKISGIDFIYEKVDFSEKGYAILIDKSGIQKKIKL